MKYWIIKSEGTVYSIDDFKRDKTTLWEGVRNYQARNNLQGMKPKDLLLFYHSSCEQIGFYGLGEVLETGIVDPFQFDVESQYYDSASKKESPRWYSPKFKFIEKFKKPVLREEILTLPSFKESPFTAKGSRLSVVEATKLQFQDIVKRGR
jgi:predicted RNA-binding protein with PUA-like domain